MGTCFCKKQVDFARQSLIPEKVVLMKNSQVKSQLSQDSIYFSDPPNNVQVNEMILIQNLEQKLLDLEKVLNFNIKDLGVTLEQLAHILYSLYDHDDNQKQNATYYLIQTLSMIQNEYTFQQRNFATIGLLQVFFQKVCQKQDEFTELLNDTRWKQLNNGEVLDKNLLNFFLYSVYYNCSQVIKEIPVFETAYAIVIIYYLEIQKQDQNEFIIKLLKENQKIGLNGIIQIVSKLLPPEYFQWFLQFYEDDGSNLFNIVYSVIQKKHSNKINEECVQGYFQSILMKYNLSQLISSNKSYQDFIAKNNLSPFMPKNDYQDDWSVEQNIKGDQEKNQIVISD